MYSPKDPSPISADCDHSNQSTTFHLLGRVSTVLSSPSELASPGSRSLSGRGKRATREINELKANGTAGLKVQKVLMRLSRVSAVIC